MTLALAVVPPMSNAIAASRSSISQSAIVPTTPPAPRFHKLDTLAPRHFDIRETAVGLHNHQAACEAFAPQAPLEVAQIVIHLGTDVGVRRHRRGALVFPVLPRELMRSADEEIRIGFAENLAHADLMLRSAIRM